MDDRPSHTHTHNHPRHVNHPIASQAGADGGGGGDGVPPRQQPQPQQHYLATLADDIVKESMRKGSRDNITALVVRLRPEEDGGDEKRGLMLVGEGGKEGRESTDSAGSGSGRRALQFDDNERRNGSEELQYADV